MSDTATTALADVAVIGGTGFYSFLDDPVSVAVDTPYGSVEKISMRLHGMHWKGRELFVQTLAR